MEVCRDGKNKKLVQNRKSMISRNSKKKSGETMEKVNQYAFFENIKSRSRMQDKKVKVKYHVTIGIKILIGNK